MEVHFYVLDCGVLFKVGEFTLVETAYMAALKHLPDAFKDEEQHLQLLFDLAEFFTDLGLYSAARLVKHLP